MEKGSLPPLKPVFGVPLEELYARDGTAVPFLVYQCFQAVELFGLNMEGIYRLSGSANHISHMKAVFDNGKLSKVLCKGEKKEIHTKLHPQTRHKSTSPTPRTSITMSIVLPDW
jgi:hypothetical protein